MWKWLSVGKKIELVMLLLEHAHKHVMRGLSFLLLLAVAAQGQVRLHFGVEAGVPLTNAFHTSGMTVDLLPGEPIFHEAYSSKTKRLLIGPTVRLDLPLGLGLQLDALYQRINYNYEETDAVAGPLSPSEHFSQYTANRWQFPLLLEYKVNAPFLKPFIDAGPSLSHIANTHDVQVLLNGHSASSTPSTLSTDELPELRHSTVFGITAGFGVDLHVAVMHIRPEFRYVRWTSSQFSGTISTTVTALGPPSRFPDHDSLLTKRFDNLRK